MEMTGPIIVTIVFAVAIAISVIIAIIRGQRRRLVTGVEEMVGKVAVALTELNPKGTVQAEGEIWNAVTEKGRIEPDEEVIITKVEGLKLWVIKNSEEKEDK